MIIPDTVVRSYLRLDTDEDIGLYIETAEDYFNGAIGRDPDPEKSREIYVVCALTQEFYDNRTLIADDPMKDRLRHVISSLLDHIRFDDVPEDGDDDEG